MVCFEALFGNYLYFCEPALPNFACVPKLVRKPM